VTAAACVPTGSAPPYDAGATPQAQLATFKPSVNVMTAPFEDTFDRPDAAEGTWPGFGADASTGGLVLEGDGGAGRDAQAGGGFWRDAAPQGPAASSSAALGGDAAAGDGGAASAGDRSDGGALLATLLRDGRDGGAEAGAERGPVSHLGPNWNAVRTSAWRIENGKMCVQNAHNHGVWLNRTLPINARIEFDAVAGTDDGDLKTEVWGDGVSAATGTSYTNATSYLAILGGWKNTRHVLARLNEHGTDRKDIAVDKESDDPRQRPVMKGQVYRFKVERTDGKTIRWSVDGVDYASWVDPAPLAGQGHDHFGFNEWEAKVCFDNVKVTPL